MPAGTHRCQGNFPGPFSSNMMSPAPEGIQDFHCQSAQHLKKKEPNCLKSKGRSDVKDLEDRKRKTSKGLFLEMSVIRRFILHCGFFKRMSMAHSALLNSHRKPGQGPKRQRGSSTSRTPGFLCENSHSQG